MNAIVFYLAGVVAIALLLSTVAILLGVSDMPKSQMGSNMLLAVFFAALAWFAALDISEYDHE